MKRSSGFTLIEVVIAMAIGILIVVAVIGTVQSLSRAAKRMEESGAIDEEWLRFAQIFRRDVRGWVQGEERRAESRPADTNTTRPFFVCQTTADALAGGAEAGNRSPARMASVRYAVKRTGEEFVIVRQEEGGEGIFEVPVLHAQAEPKVEFFDGQRWNAGHQGQRLPVAVKFTVGQRAVVIASPWTEGPTDLQSRPAQR
jgi:type II secretory pathway component PulJ